MDEKDELLNLDDREQSEKEMREYLKRECPHCFDAQPVSIELVNDFVMPLFKGYETGRILVYEVKLENALEVFGTVGGMLYPRHPPYLNVFLKSIVKKADIAASMHLYWEAKNRYGDTSVFKIKENLEQLADMLELPLELR